MPKHLLITGRVQGVGYRYSLRREALRLGLAGWVRNRHDGSVEAMVEGPPDELAMLVTWARAGPPAAEVEAVTVTDSPERSGFSGFEQRPDA